MKHPIELVSYRVSVRPDSWGRIEPKSRGTAGPTKLCFEAMRGEPKPCESCPLRGPSPPSGLAYTLLSSNGDVYEFVAARRRGDVADVWLLRMRTDMVNALRIEKFQLLAGRAALSPRESRVLELIVTGSQTKEIASALGISARTAKFHTANLLRKIGADSRATLLRMLIGPLEPDPVTAGASERAPVSSKRRPRRTRSAASGSS